MKFSLSDSYRQTLTQCRSISVLSALWEMASYIIDQFVFLSKAGYDYAGKSVYCKMRKRWDQEKRYSPWMKPILYRSLPHGTACEN